MPPVLVSIPMGFEASRNQVRGLDGGYLSVERDLLAAGVPPAAAAVGKPGFEDQRPRCLIGGALIAQSEPDDAREYRMARVYHHDAANSPTAERAGTAKQ